MGETYLQLIDLFLYSTIKLSSSLIFVDEYEQLISIEGKREESIQKKSGIKSPFMENDRLCRYT